MTITLHYWMIPVTVSLVILLWPRFLFDAEAIMDEIAMRFACVSLVWNVYLILGLLGGVVVLL